jgi:hypothetical protein
MPNVEAAYMFHTLFKLSGNHLQRALQYFVISILQCCGASKMVRFTYHASHQCELSRNIERSTAVKYV